MFLNLFLAKEAPLITITLSKKYLLSENLIRNKISLWLLTNTVFYPFHHPWPCRSCFIYYWKITFYWKVWDSVAWRRSDAPQQTSTNSCRICTRTDWNLNKYDKVLKAQESWGKVLLMRESEESWLNPRTLNSEDIFYGLLGRSHREKIL